ncbi:radical SAM protein [Oceanicaulis sp. LC35]|uniref:radical SAM protein n=1 Tax=Oceanicaulis sp. LC35 TaxID=3349635 RepID=UPI003F83CB0C
MPDASAPLLKFSDPVTTAKGERRAAVGFDTLKTLWFNTGTLCNIECKNCYILSSPTNDALVYLSEADVISYLEEIDALGFGDVEIGFTGGEPFMNPDMIRLMEVSLERGHRVLVLTNAMKPMMRPRVQQGLLDLQARHGDRIEMRLSLDHYTRAYHDAERGPGGFDATIEGMQWLASHGFTLSAAGRSLWNETDAEARAGFKALFDRLGVDIPSEDPARLVIFPEMDEAGDPPEITVACWGILDQNPKDIMCASQRMVIKRRGAERPSVIACTLLPYESEFELADTLAASLKPVSLNHKYCAQFCVLGGASCSA